MMKKGDVKACMNEIAQAGTGPDVVREKSQYLMVLGKYEFMWHLSREQGQGFADKRKKKIQYEYLKTLKKEKRKNEQTNAGEFSNKQSSNPEEKGKFKGKWSVNRYSKVNKESQRQKEAKRKKKEEAERRKQERDEALLSYNKQKKENFKKLCKKTHRGQPVMKNQMEYLLAKIEKQYQVSKGEKQVDNT